MFQEREKRWFDRKSDEIYWDDNFEPSYGLQINLAMFTGNLEYVGYMLDLGADINIGGVDQSIVKSAVESHYGDSKYYVSCVLLPC